MGCFLTTTAKDLNQIKGTLAKSSVTKSTPMSTDQFLEKVKDDVCDVAETCLSANPSKLEAASKATSFDEVNDVLGQIDEAISDGYLGKGDAAKEADSMLSDVASAGKVPGIESQMELLGKYQVGSSEWRGARFELRYAALNASHIAEVACYNQVDVQMKDGSYRELKSFTSFGRDQRDQIMDSLRKHIDPNYRGVNDIKVVLDTSYSAYSAPSASFLNQVQANIEQLKSELGSKATVGCEIVSRSGEITTVF